MNTYKVPVNTRVLIFSIVEDELSFDVYLTSEDDSLTETDIFDCPHWQQTGQSMEIEDSRFAIVEDYAKYGYYVFQRWIEDDPEDLNKRVIAIVKEKDVIVE